MKFVPDFTIEGIATALGVLGAAVGYVISLVSGWLRERRERKYRGTNLAILDLLQEDPWKAFPASELQVSYSSKEFAEKRKRYGALPPKKLPLLDFRRQLIRLQLDFLIDLAGKDSYSIRVRPPSAYDQRQAYQEAVRSFVASKVTVDEVLKAARGALANTKDRYARRDALRLLLRLRDPQALEEGRRALQSEDPDVALDAAGAFGEFLSR